MADPTTTYINLVDVVPDWEQRLDENLESDWDNILGLLSLNQVCDAPEKTLQWALAQQWKKKREQFGKDIADLQKNVAGQNDMEVDEVVNLPDEVDGLSLSDKDAEKVAEAEVDKVMTALDGSKELKKKDEKQVRKELKKKAVDALRKGNSLPAEAVVDVLKSSKKKKPAGKGGAGKAGKSTKTSSKGSTTFQLVWDDLVDTCRRMDGAPEETYELDQVPLAYFDWAGKLDDIELHKIVVGKVKQGTGIGNFIARMNQFGLGRLIIAKHNRVVREEEENERKMIFQSRSRTNSHGNSNRQSSKSTNLRCS
eukprot:m.352215 g.352215  ORF g.352215 m.352215 type:complete len:310 (-) comp16581_c2_seq16:87-1016(-)